MNLAKPSKFYTITISRKYKIMLNKVLITTSLLSIVSACQVQGDNKFSVEKTPINAAQTLITSTLAPASDQKNQEGWLLNTKVSDEFNAKVIDESKWYVQGKNKEFYLWKGRAPSQFAPHNVSQKDGKLILTTQWQPDYEFVGQPPKKQAAEGYKYENITTAAVIAQNSFLYGYMEVKVKIPKAAMTGAFWATGYHSEIDIFEHIGKVNKGNADVEKKFTTSIHDWRPGHPAKNKVWKTTKKIDFDMTEDFHVFGVEWSDEFLKVYIDGELVSNTPKAEIGDAWVLNNPLELWFDSEVFPWHGIPKAENLPATFEVDYVRVWQKPNPNLLEPAFFGFEGPYIKKVSPRPDNRQKYAQEWFIKDSDTQFFSITDDKDFMFASGRKSLKFQHSEALQGKEVTAFSPNGSVSLPAGKFELSMDVWLEPNSNIKQLDITLEAPWKVLKAIDLRTIEVGKWVKVSTEFTRENPSAENDRLRVIMLQKHLVGTSNTVYIDNISITKKQ